MKRLGFLAIAISFITMEMRGQNLVPNPGFETKISCPNDQDQLWKCPPWYRPTANTSDYFNACSTIPQSNFLPGVPGNYLGYQYAHSGNAYTGVACYYGGNSRDYIEVPLLDTLKANVRYCVSFYVSLADSSLDGISPIGAYFSNSLIDDQSTIACLPFSPQVSSPLQIPLSDTSNWTLVSGIFMANGGERFMTIGTFLPDSLIAIDTTIRPRSNSYAKMAYYYIDDVSVIPIATCVAGADVQICYKDSLQLGILPDSDATYSWQPTEGLSDPAIANPKASPYSTTTYTLTQTQCNVTSTASVKVTVDHDCNSASEIVIPTTYVTDDRLFIYGLEQDSRVEVLDMQGRIVFNADHYQNDFGISALREGMYIVRLYRPGSAVLVKRVVVL